MSSQGKWFLLDQVRAGSWGGGNSFLRGFSDSLGKSGQLTIDWREADFVLINSFPFSGLRRWVNHLDLIRRKRPNVKVVHRIDGPISVSRGYPRQEYIDRAVFEINRRFSDLTVFQSQWSMNESLKLGFSKSSEVRVIGNAVNKNVFSPVLKKGVEADKIRIVTSSWSGNPQKGMSTYSFLDRELDFGRYDYQFFGPQQTFASVKNMGRVGQSELASRLQQSDFFITASRNDSCSNSLLEAMACGLTPLALDHGGHPEIIGDPAFLFKTNEELLEKLESGNKMYKPDQNVKGFDEVRTLYQLEAEEVELRSRSRKSVFSFENLGLLNGVAKRDFTSAIENKLGGVMAPKIQHFFVDSMFKDLPSNYWAMPPREFLELDFPSLKMHVSRFLETMQHMDQPNLFRFSWSGDTYSKPMLITSVYALKLHKILGKPASNSLIEHVFSFRRENGEFYEDYLLRRQPLADTLELVLQRKSLATQRADSIRAQNRQSISSLLEAGINIQAQDEILTLPFDDMKALIRDLSWTNPWHAASHVSHMVFFLKNSGFPANAGQASQLIREAHRFFSPELAVSSSEISARLRINGLMKMVTAYQWSPVETNEAVAKQVVDLCLNIIENRHACDQFNLLLVLRYFSDKAPGYRLDEIANFARTYKAGLAAHFWPGFGGFSFYPRRSQFALYGKKVSLGLREPDLHGTVMLTWALAELESLLGDTGPRQFQSLRP